MEKNKKHMFVGVDPSINSTGVTIRICDDSLQETNIEYYILKGDSHEVTKTGKLKSPLSRAEVEASEKYSNFNYILYDKVPQTKEGASVENELAKTKSFISLTDRLLKLIKEEITRYEVDDLYIVIEGISYGSTLRTTAVFDLAGLNYMIRSVFMKFTENVIVAPPSHVKKFATGNGSAKKDLMIATFQAIHPELVLPKIDDIADSFFMSRLAQRYYEQTKY